MKKLAVLLVMLLAGTNPLDADKPACQECPFYDPDKPGDHCISEQPAGPDGDYFCFYTFHTHFIETH